MGESIKAPLVHGRMIYRCENCGQSWFMYLGKGIEEFGENHKPSPFTIFCPYCGGLACDVSGIQKIPGGGYMPLPDDCHYFANMEKRSCGVPLFCAKTAGKLVARNAPILIADELETATGDQRDRRSEQEENKDVLKDIQERVKKYINDVLCAELAKLAELTAVETQELAEEARIFAEQSTFSLEEVTGAIMNAVGGYSGMDEQGEEKGEFFDIKTAWDRKEAREKRRAVERETASRFRQHKARAIAWTVRKRTNPRKREWRGSWRTENRTN